MKGAISSQGPSNKAHSEVYNVACWENAIQVVHALLERRKNGQQPVPALDDPALRTDAQAEGIIQLEMQRITRCKKAPYKGKQPSDADRQDVHPPSMDARRATALAQWKDTTEPLKVTVRTMRGNRIDALVTAFDKDFTKVQQEALRRTEENQQLLREVEDGLRAIRASASPRRTVQGMVFSPEAHPVTQTPIEGAVQQAHAKRALHMSPEAQTQAKAGPVTGGPETPGTVKKPQEPGSQHVEAGESPTKTPSKRSGKKRRTKMKQGEEDTGHDGA